MNDTVSLQPLAPRGFRRYDWHTGLLSPVVDAPVVEVPGVGTYTFPAELATDAGIVGFIRQNLVPPPPPGYALDAPALPDAYVTFNARIDDELSQRLAKALSNLIERGARRIHLAMTSPGGSLDQALYLYNFLRALPVELTTHNISTVRSEAIFPFLAGARRLATPSSTFSFHPTRYERAGAAGAFVTADEHLLDVMAEATGHQREFVRRFMTSEVACDLELARVTVVIHAVESFSIAKNVLVVSV